MKIRRGSIRLTEQDLVKLVKELDVKPKQSNPQPVLVKKETK